jgi:hypothetical protein
VPAPCNAKDYCPQILLAEFFNAVRRLRPFLNRCLAAAFSWHAPGLRPPHRPDRTGKGKAQPGWPKIWWRRLRRVWLALARDNISIMAAGAAYYSMLSIFPAMSALVLTYGLVADPVTIERHLDSLRGILPDQAFELVADQLHLLVTAPATRLGLGLGLVFSVLIALWTATSASTGMMGITAYAVVGWFLYLCFIGGPAGTAGHAGHSYSGRGSTPSAECQDRSTSFSQNHQGTCSWHGGVVHWWR